MTEEDFGMLHTEQLGLKNSRWRHGLLALLWGERWYGCWLDGDGDCGGRMRGGGRW